MSQQAYTGTVVESRVDWLTMSASGTEERLALAAYAQDLVTEQAEAGNDPRPWTHLGYAGFGTKHAKWGERPDTDLLILSGALADEKLAEVLPFASNVSRLDMCVTARLPEAGDEVITEGYESGRTHVFNGGHRPAFELLQHSQRGATLYVGSRSSRLYGRVYNKHRESELAYYAGCYRYEVEQKGNVALARARSLAADPDRGGTIGRDVYTFFDTRGISPRFDPGDGRLSVPAYRPHSDDNRRLLWLSGQVRKSVETLIDHGLREQALFALGLDDLHQELDRRRAEPYNGRGGHAGPAVPNQGERE